MSIKAASTQPAAAPTQSYLQNESRTAGSAGLFLRSIDKAMVANGQASGPAGASSSSTRRSEPGISNPIPPRQGPTRPELAIPSPVPTAATQAPSAGAQPGTPDDFRKIAGSLNSFGSFKLVQEGAIDTKEAGNRIFVQDGKITRVSISGKPDISDHYTKLLSGQPVYTSQPTGQAANGLGLVLDAAQGRYGQIEAVNQMPSSDKPDFDTIADTINEAGEIKWVEGGKDTREAGNRIYVENGRITSVSIWDNPALSAQLTEQLQGQRIFQAPPWGALASQGGLVHTGGPGTYTSVSAVKGLLSDKPAFNPGFLTAIGERIQSFADTYGLTYQQASEFLTKNPEVFRNWSTDQAIAPGAKPFDPSFLSTLG